MQQADLRSGSELQPTPIRAVGRPWCFGGLGISRTVRHARDVIVHNVLFKLKDPDQIEPTARLLRSMEGQIEGLASIEVGIDRVHSSRSHHIALITRFESWEDLDRYRAHPVHQPVLEHMAEVTESAAVVDFEI